MNWVGGVRDKVHRNAQTLMKQKEYFEKKRIARHKQKNIKSGKKGVSRDILNLRCISTTVRNPFDEKVAEKVFAPAPSKLRKISDNSVFDETAVSYNARKKQFLKINSYKGFHKTERKSSCGSSHQPNNFNMRNQRLFSNRRNVDNATALYQSTPLPSKEPYLPKLPDIPVAEDSAPHRRFPLPSPIQSKENTQMSNIQPLTFLSDYEAQHTDHSHSSNFSQYHAVHPNIADDTRYSDLLHGVASASNYPKTSCSVPKPLQPHELDCFSQYEMINDQLMPHNSPPRFYSQKLPPSAAAPSKFPESRRPLRNLNPSYSLFHCTHLPSSQMPCDLLSVKQEIDDENIFANHTTLMSGSYHGDISSSDSSPTCFSSLLTSGKSSISRKHCSPISSPEPPSTKLAETRVPPKVSLVCLEKAVQVGVSKTIDVATSPIKWPSMATGVQTVDKVDFSR